MVNKKTYTTTQIKAQGKKYKVAASRYLKAVEKESPTRADKKHAEELHYKAADAFEKLQEMKANRKRK